MAIPKGYIRSLSKWDNRGFEAARMAATWSKDPSTKVGCSVFGPDNGLISVGFNGFPKGVEDSHKLLMDKEEKRLRIIHAERNAIRFSRKASLSESRFYVTHPCCAQCASDIIAEGADIVMCEQGPEGLGDSWKKSIAVASEMLWESGIPLLFKVPNSGLAVPLWEYDRVKKLHESVPPPALSSPSSSLLTAVPSQSRALTKLEELTLAHENLKRQRSEVYLNLAIVEAEISKLKGRLQRS